jgi:hypothetical protein
MKCPKHPRYKGRQLKRDGTIIRPRAQECFECETIYEWGVLKHQLDKLSKDAGSAGRLADAALYVANRASR